MAVPFSNTKLSKYYFISYNFLKLDNNMIQNI